MEEYAKDAAQKEQFAGLDVSFKDVSVCVSDGAGQGDIVAGSGYQRCRRRGLGPVSPAPWSIFFFLRRWDLQSPAHGLFNWKGSRLGGARALGNCE